MLQKYADMSMIWIDKVEHVGYDAIASKFVNKDWPLTKAIVRFSPSAEYMHQIGKSMQLVGTNC